MFLAREEGWIRDWLRRAAKKPFTRDEAVECVLISRETDAFVRESVPVLERMLEQDNTDPFFCACAYELGPEKVRNVASEMLDLDAIKEEAVRRRDQAALRRVRDLEELSPEFGQPWADVDDEEEDEEPAAEELSAALDMFNDFPMPEDLPPNQREAVVELLDEISRVPTLENMKKLKQRFRHRIPEALFEKVSALAMLAAGLAAMSNPSRGSGSVSDQMDLF